MSEVKYAEDRPKDCRYCYFWSGKKKGCDLGGEENCCVIQLWTSIRINVRHH